MQRAIRTAILATFAVAATAGAQAQAGSAAPAPAPVVPAAGEAAPDFTAMATDSTGKTWPVTLAGLKGKVVVLAFYPLDRSGGCTAELSKFRDEYKTLFGDGVVVLPTSIDSLGSHASWAKDAHFPFAMIADTKGELATKYGSQGGARPYFRRTIFVIGKDGKIAYSSANFNALAQDGYDKLAAAIKTAKAS
ncbi:MAG TPA: peroxiredoxin family protein [Gemmatimonadaceae bacterium]|nr:peroxiredoxin family protein [Gemmatimonadaceae bacterium]